jgi:hypothetical protein
VPAVAKPPMHKRLKLGAERAAHGGGASPTDSECEGTDLNAAAMPYGAVSSAALAAGVCLAVGCAVDKRKSRLCSPVDLESPRSSM